MQDNFKICLKCKSIKALDLFYYNKSRGKLRYSGRCKSCLIQDVTPKTLSEKELLNQRRRDRYAARREHFAEQKRIWNRNHPEKLRATLRRWETKNREYRRIYVRNLVKKYPHKSAAQTAKYRAALEQRVPKWANLKQIQNFYRNCPKGYHVDHIIPLRGKYVSGLHVIENLQYLPAVENMRKSNKIELGKY